MESDEALFDRWGAGDRSAGEALFERHFASIYRFFRGKLEEPDAQESTQETFLGCLRSRDQWRREASFRTFLFAVARKHLLLHFRRRARKEDKLDFGTVSLADIGTSPTARLAATQAERWLAQALSRLPLELQLVLELHYWDELTLAEIAVVCEVPLGTIKSRVRRARELLTRELERIDPATAAAMTTVEALGERVAALRNALPLVASTS